MSDRHYGHETTTAWFVLQSLGSVSFDEAASKLYFMKCILSLNKPVKNRLDLYGHMNIMVLQRLLDLLFSILNLF
jgi:hypothetical protein